MHTTQTSLTGFLGQRDVQLVIPPFQRVYSWEARQCEELFDDALAAGRAGAEHFTGVVLYSVDPECWTGREMLDIVDGQQRLTTFTILLAALADWMRAHGSGEAGYAGAVDAAGDEAGEEPGAPKTVRGVGRQAVRGAVPDALPGPGELYERYLSVEDGAGRAGKLVLNGLDRFTLFAVASGAELPEERSQRIVDNYGLLRAKMDEPSFDARVLWRGLSSLAVIATRLEGGDNAQLVFESLNSKGMALSTGDLVRSQLIASIPDDGERTRLLQELWEPLEELAEGLEGAGGNAGGVNAAMEMWLAQDFRNVRIHDKSQVYAAFKAQLQTHYLGKFEPALRDLAAFTRRLKNDPAFCAEAARNAADWLAGKPKELVSEFKMFGD